MSFEFGPANGQVKSLVVLGTLAVLGTGMLSVVFFAGGPNLGVDGVLHQQALPKSEGMAGMASGTLASAESDGFFDELDWRWMLRKLIHIHQASVDESCELECFHGSHAPCEGSKWFQLHFEPSFLCPFERKVGPRGWQGKWICDPHRIDELAQARGCLVYLFQEDDARLQFASAVHNEVSKLCEIHVFRSKRLQFPVPSFVQHHVLQIGSKPPAVPIQRLVEELGHSGRTIDLLQIDCNGCEWEQYTGWFHKDVEVRQFLVRLSWPTLFTSPSSPRPHPPFLQTQNAPVAVRALKKLFKTSGFVVTHKDFDTETCDGNCVDISFFKFHPAFQHLHDLTPSSPFYALKSMQIPSRSCFESHPGLGPLSDSASLQRELHVMFQGIDQVGPVSSIGLTSLRESRGFIDEPDSTWLRRKLIHRGMLADQLQAVNHLRYGMAPFWYYNFYPSFKCEFARRLGRAGDGGKWVCDPHRLTLRASQGCLVYSIGSSGESTFETAVHESISPLCEIHAFDRYPWRYYTTDEMPTFMNYHTQQIGRVWPSKSVAQIMIDLHHSGRTIDILKVQCEHCEWETYQSWFNNASVDIRMILAKLHPTDRVEAINSFFRYLQNMGYVIYSKEPNTFGCQGTCQEYAFIKFHPTF